MLWLPLNSSTRPTIITWMTSAFSDITGQGPKLVVSRKMEKIELNPIYEYNPNQLQEVRRLFGFNDVDKLNEAIDQFEDWIKKQNHFTFKDFDRDFLERIIIFNKGSIERAKQRLDKMCTMRTLMPELMGNIDVKNEFHSLLSISYHCIFPKPTKDHYRVQYSSINVKDNSVFDLLHYYRYMVTTMHYAYCHEYCAGFEIITDLREFSLSLMSKMSPTVAHKGITLMTDGFGCRMKSLHLISSSKYVDALVTFFKQVLSEKLAKRIHVHSSYDTLKNYIDKSILPVELGGEFDKTLKEINDDVFKELSSDSHVAYVNLLEKAMTDESRRLTSSFNEEYSGMPGSFRTFCVD